MPEFTIDAYDRQAAQYESRWKNYLDHTHEAFLRRIETNAQDTILDVSGGTGLLALKLIERRYPFHRLIVNDPSEQMLAIARDRLADKSSVSFTNDKAEELTFEDNCFDRIFCLNAFHFYSDQQQCFAMLKPRGRLYILDWNRTGWFRIINQIIAWSTSEHIETRSLAELLNLLREDKFQIEASDSWRWRYWKFLFAEGYKPS